jgi:hypothetical protein
MEHNIDMGSLVVSEHLHLRKYIFWKCINGNRGISLNGIGGIRGIRGGCFWSLSGGHKDSRILFMFVWALGWKYRYENIYVIERTSICIDICSYSHNRTWQSSRMFAEKLGTSRNRYFSYLCNKDMSNAWQSAWISYRMLMVVRTQIMRNARGRLWLSAWDSCGWFLVLCILSYGSFMTDCMECSWMSLWISHKILHNYMCRGSADS